MLTRLMSSKFASSVTDNSLKSVLLVLSAQFLPQDLHEVAHNCSHPGLNLDLSYYCMHVCMYLPSCSALLCPVLYKQSTYAT